MNLLYVAFGSAAGGVLRWLVGEAVHRRLGPPSVVAGAIPFPAGTLFVNVSGSLLLGALAVVVARRPGGGEMLRLLLMVGFCGGYTTFSTFSLETMRLLEGEAYGRASAYVVTSVALSLAATLAGIAIARAMVPRG